MGRLTSIDRAFTDETRTYDSANRLLTIDNTSVGQATYTWDANSNKLSETWTGNMAAWSFTTEKSGGTFTDGYDAEDRFRRFIQSSQSNDIYLARSDIGNISDVEINSVSNLRSYSNAHELTSVDGTTQTFDDDGNLTLSHHGITVAWDDANRLTQTVVPPTATAGVEGTNDYGYDADGKRVFKKITRSGAVAEHTVYIYAGPNCIAEYDSGALAASPVQEYVYADGIDSLVLLSRDSDADRYVTTRNQQWSITALADISNGTVQERYTYDPFGKRTVLAPDGSTLRTASSYNMPYGYTSRRHDPESDLMYFRARHYDPSTGEFTSRDPLEYVDGMSMMRGYIDLTHRDPTGSEAISITPKGNLLGFLACDTTPYQSWDFRIVGSVPCVGWFVQKVTVTCHGGACGEPDQNNNCCWPDVPTGPANYKVFTYYEAWPVTDTGREVSDWRKGGDNYNDTADFSVPDQTRGDYHQRGEVRYFCSEDGRLAKGIGDLRGTWHYGERDGVRFYGGGTACDTSPDKLVSTGGGGDARLFAFWDDPEFDTGITPATREFSVNWQCCRGCKRADKWLNARARPSDDR